MTDQADSTATLLADNRDVIRCGCGFLAVSDDQESNLAAFEDHPCTLRGDRWYHHLFSLWGALLVLVIGSAVIGVLKALS